MEQRLTVTYGGEVPELRIIIDGVAVVSVDNDSEVLRRQVHGEDHLKLLIEDLLARLIKAPPLLLSFRDHVAQVPHLRQLNGATNKLEKVKQSKNKHGKVKHSKNKHGKAEQRKK